MRGFMPDRIEETGGLTDRLLLYPGVSYGGKGVSSEDSAPLRGCSEIRRGVEARYMAVLVGGA